MKGLLSKIGGSVAHEDFRQALLAWRNTPRADGFSPAFGFFGRHIRGCLPDVRDPSTRLNPTSFELARKATRDTAVVNSGGHDLVPLHPGDKVYVQHRPSSRWSLDGTVVDVRPLK